ncbi:MAG: hypothetical protein ACR2JJ_09105 [Sphingomicrobium sp.]
MIAIPHSLALKLVIAAGCALMLTLLIHDRNRWKAKTAHYSELLSGERAAHSATVANYRLAAEQARRQDAENLERVKAEQTAISERTAYDFTSRIAATRARADELQRHAGTTADSGSRGAAHVPGISAPAEGAPESAGEDRLSDADALIATEQAIQLDELIKWVKAQSTVDPNGPQLRPAVPQDVPRATGSLRLNYR